MSTVFLQMHRLTVLVTGYILWHLVQFLMCLKEATAPWILFLTNPLAMV